VWTGQQPHHVENSGSRPWLVLGRVTAWEHHLPLAFHSGREAPSSAEVKEWVELYLHSPNAPSWCGAQLGGAQCVDWIQDAQDRDQMQTLVNTGMNMRIL
jgi:hypothetical protein